MTTEISVSGVESILIFPVSGVTSELVKSLAVPELSSVFELSEVVTLDKLEDTSDESEEDVLVVVVTESLLLVDVELSSEELSEGSCAAPELIVGCELDAAEMMLLGVLVDSKTGVLSSDCARLDSSLDSARTNLLVLAVVGLLVWLSVFGIASM